MGRFAAIVVLFAFVFAMMVPEEFAIPDDPGEAPSTHFAAVAPDAPDEEQVTEEPALPFSDMGTSIQRGADGQFRIDARINGQQVPFLVDTGADQVALTIDDARRIGLVVDPQNFVPVGMGAGGVVNGQRVSLDSVELVGHEIGAIDAVVIDGLDQNLLGQSVLRQVARLELSGDAMIIH